MVGWSLQSAARALQALDADELDADAVATHVKTMTTVVQTWRAFEVKTWRACYDGVLARLLIVTGERDGGRGPLDVALEMGQDTWIQFYDAELLRMRAHTLDDVANGINNSGRRSSSPRNKKRTSSNSVRPPMIST